MKFEINSMFCVLVVLTGSSQTRGQSETTTPVPTLAALPSHVGSSASPDLTEDPGNEARQWTHNPAGRDETAPQTTTVTKAEATVHSEDAANAEHETHLLTTGPAVAAPAITTASPSAAAEGLSSTPSSTPPEHLSTAGGGALLTTDPLTTFSSQPAHTAQDARSTAHASTVQPQSESLTTASTGQPLSSAPGRAPAGPTHPELSSELNVGDEDLKGPRFRSSSPLDPLLAGLLSVFIVTTAIVFVVLFLKFRQRTNHPEFHRLQDLPMDDLMEDTPLSRYTY